MNRRNFLAGLSTAAGVAMLAPFMRANANTGTPRRFVFVVEGNGTEPVNYMTPDTRTAIDAQVIASSVGRRHFPHLYGHEDVLVQNDDLTLAPSLTPLGPDLTGLSQVVLGLSSTVTGGGHTTNFGGLSSTRSTPGRPGGPTIDAVLAAAAAVRGTTPFDAVRLGVHALTSALNTTTCAYDVARPAPVLMDPIQAFTNLFGAVGDPASQAAFGRRGRLLDYASADVTATLNQFAGNSQERAKLESYLHSLEAVNLRQQQLLHLASQTTTDCGLPTLSDVVPESPHTNPLYTSDDPFERMQAHFDMTEAALRGGLTNVAVLTMGTGGGFDLPYPTLTNLVNRHKLHHFDGIDSTVGIPIIATATRLLVEKAANLARSLAATPEGDGSMLDNTLIVVLSDNGETHHSSAEEFPLLLIGGQNMGFTNNDGRTTVFPGVRNADNRQMSNFYNTLGHAAGLDLNDFGSEGPTRIAQGPLTELRP